MDSSSSTTTTVNCGELGSLTSPTPLLRKKRIRKKDITFWEELVSLVKESKGQLMQWPQPGTADKEKESHSFSGCTTSQAKCPVPVGGNSSRR